MSEYEESDTDIDDDCDVDFILSSSASYSDSECLSEYSDEENTLDESLTPDVIVENIENLPETENEQSESIWSDYVGRQQIFNFSGIVVFSIHFSFLLRLCRMLNDRWQR